jgi:hypothetical protein
MTSTEQSVDVTMEDSREANPDKTEASTQQEEDEAVSLPSNNSSESPIEPTTTDANDAREDVEITESPSKDTTKSPPTFAAANSSNKETTTIDDSSPAVQDALPTSNNDTVSPASADETSPALERTEPNVQEFSTSKLTEEPIATPQRPVKRARTAYFIYIDENRYEIQKQVSKRVSAY